MSKLYMMFGFPGAGKTTAAEIISELTGAVHLSSDRLRIEMFGQPSFTQKEHDELYDELNKRTEELLRAGKDVIYDANLNRHIHRQEKYEICHKANSDATLIWVQTPKDIAKNRAIDEIRKPLWPTHETPNSMFERIADVIEPPTAEEAYISLDGTKISPTYIKSQLGL